MLHAVRICVGLFFRNLNSPLRRVLVGTHVDIAKYLLVLAESAWTQALDFDQLPALQTLDLF